MSAEWKLFTTMVTIILVSVAWFTLWSRNNPPPNCAAAIDRCEQRLGCSYARELCK